MLCPKYNICCALVHIIRPGNLAFGYVLDKSFRDTEVECGSRPDFIRKV